MSSGINGTTEIDSSAVDGKNPFVGPESLGRHDPLFGRDWDLDRLFDLLQSERIVLLYAPSGAGKTSLIQAQGGLLDRMKEARFRVMAPARVSKQFGDLGKNTNRYVSSLVRSFWDDREEWDPDFQNDLLTYLKIKCPEHDEQGVFQTWFLVIDQFEEVLTLEVADQEKKAEFFRQLGDVMQEWELRHVWFLLAMREEYVAWLDRFVHYLPNQLQARYHLDLLNDSDAGHVIRSLAGRGRPVRTFDEDALAAMVTDLSRVPQFAMDDGSKSMVPTGYVEPLYLQIVCKDLWQCVDSQVNHIEQDHIDKCAKIEDALTRFYENSLKCMDLGEKEREVREWIDAYLILNGLHRRTLLREDAAAKLLSKDIVDRLISNRLLREEKRRNHLVEIELAHDRLVEPIHSSNKLWFSNNPDRYQSWAKWWYEQGEPDHALVTGDSLRCAESYWNDKKERRYRVRAYERDFLERSLEAEKQRKQEAEKMEQEQSIALRSERSRRIRWTLLSIMAGLLLMAGTVFVKSIELETKNTALSKANEELKNTTNILDSKTKDLEDIQERLVIALGDARNGKADAEKGRAEAEQQRRRTAELLKLVKAQAISHGAFKLQESSYADELPALLVVQAYRFAKRDAHNPGNPLGAIYRPLTELGGRDVFRRIIHTRDVQDMETPVIGAYGRICVEEHPFGKTSDFYLLGESGITHRELPSLGPKILAVEMSHGDEHIAVLTPSRVTVWNKEFEEDARPLIDYPVEGIETIAFSHDGQWLAVAGAEGRLELISLVQANKIIKLEEPMEATLLKVAFHPSKPLITAISSDDSLYVWRIDGDAMVPYAGFPIRGLVQNKSLLAFFNYDEKDWILVDINSSDDKGINRDLGLRLLQVSTRKNRKWLKLTKKKKDVDVSYVPSAVAIQPEQGLIAIGTESGVIVLWSLGDIDNKLSVSSERKLLGHGSEIRALRFDGMRDHLTSIDRTGIVRQWLFNQQRDYVVTKTSQKGFAYALHYTIDGKHLYSSSNTEGMNIWDTSRGYVKLKNIPFELNNEGVMDFAVFPSVDSERLNHGIDPDSPNYCQTAGQNNRGGSKLAIAYRNHYVQIFDDQALSKKGMVLQGHKGQVAGVAFSADGGKLGSTGKDGKILLWNVQEIRGKASKVKPELLFESNSEFSTIAQGTNGRIAAAGGLKDILVWKNGPDNEPVRLKGHRKTVRSLAFFNGANNIEWLASASNDGTIRLWELGEKSDLSEDEVMVGHRGEVNQIDVSCDNRFLASVGSDGTSRVWFLSNRNAEPIVLSTIHGTSSTRISASSVESVAFSPDGKHLASAEGDKTSTLWVWDLDMEGFADHICEKLVSRNMSLKEWEQHIGKSIEYECTCDSFPAGEGAGKCPVSEDTQRVGNWAL